MPSLNVNSSYLLSNNIFRFTKKLRSLLLGFCYPAKLFCYLTKELCIVIKKYLTNINQHVSFSLLFSPIRQAQGDNKLYIYQYNNQNHANPLIL